MNLRFRWLNLTIAHTPVSKNSVLTMLITRRSFIQSSGFIGVSGFTAPLIPIVSADASSSPDLVFGPDEGEVYLIGPRQGRVVIKADKRTTGIGSFSLLTEDIDPGDGIPVHKHTAEEELIYIERGRGSFTFGETEYAVESGSMSLVPRGTWHGLLNTGDEMLRMVFGYSPAGFEEYFRHIGVRKGEAWKGLTDEEWARINATYGIVYR